jgi:hypothetical protein
MFIVIGYNSITINKPFDDLGTSLKAIAVEHALDRLTSQAVHNGENNSVYTSPHGA